MRDVNEMTGIRLGMYWKCTLKYVCPALLTTFFVSNLVRYAVHHPLKYTGWDSSSGAQVPVAYPTWAYFLVVLIALLCLAAIPVCVVLVRLGRKEFLCHITGECNKVYASQELEALS